jgi:hypothetical protein
MDLPATILLKEYIIPYWDDGKTTVNWRVAMSKNGKRCDVGLDQRCRDLDGEIRQKRGDTLVKTLRKTYGPEFAPEIRGDARLDTLRKRADGESLTKILKTAKHKER